MMWKLTLEMYPFSLHIVTNCGKISFSLQLVDVYYQVLLNETSAVKETIP